MAKALRAYLTRRANGLYLLTWKAPVIVAVGNTDRRDAYPEPGDAVGFNNICPWAVKLIWGVEDLPEFESVPVELSGKVTTGAIAPKEQEPLVPRLWECTAEP